MVGDLVYTFSLEQLDIIDVGNPTAPYRRGRYVFDESGYNTSLAVAGPYAYVGVGDRSAYNGGVPIIDVRDPAQPVRVGGFGFGLGVPTAIRVRNGLAYITTMERGGGGVLWIIDIRNPAEPVYRGGYGMREPAVTLELAGDWAYVGSQDYDAATGYRSRVRVLNVRNPDRVQLLGMYEALRRLYDRWVEGDRIYVADAALDLQILQASFPYRSYVPALQR